MRKILLSDYERPEEAIAEALQRVPVVE